MSVFLHFDSIKLLSLAVRYSLLTKIVTLTNLTKTNVMQKKVNIGVLETETETIEFSKLWNITSFTIMNKYQSPSSVLQDVEKIVCTRWWGIHCWFKIINMLFWLNPRWSLNYVCVCVSMSLFVVILYGSVLQ